MSAYIQIKSSAQGASRQSQNEICGTPSQGSHTPFYVAPRYYPGTLNSLGNNQNKKGLLDGPNQPFYSRNNSQTGSSLLPNLEGSPKLLEVPENPLGIDNQLGIINNARANMNKT